MDSAKLEANKALTLNANNGEAWSVLGTIAAYYDWDWDAAEKAFSRSRLLVPMMRRCIISWETSTGSCLIGNWQLKWKRKPLNWTRCWQ